jgi:ribosome-associated protein
VPHRDRVHHPPHPPEPDIDSKQLAAVCAHLAEEKKALDIRVYEVGQYLHVGDYFVVVTGTSRPHVKAIHQELHVVLKQMGELHGKPEGADLGWWVVLDYGTVIVHALQPEAREYYDLDRLYSECPELDWRAVELPDFQPADTAPASDPEALEA